MIRLLILAAFLFAPIAAIAQESQAGGNNPNGNQASLGIVPPGTSVSGYEASVAGISASGFVVAVPPNGVLRAIYVYNTTANAVTGGINIGTSSGGAQIVSAAAVGANGLVVINGSALLSPYNSATAPTPLYISAGTAWNSAVLNVRFVWDQ
ncbi:hypothetical protein [Acidisphaera sp. S103]|uniref:hypothetical protein n=1 Tax=Acidisphaera sp. S103 TaxID=1747223 RepID=UPI00131CA539|nr:hypothetical protein [Acidisphaera sp. S103]